MRGAIALPFAIVHALVGTASALIVLGTSGADRHRTAMQRPMAWRHLDHSTPKSKAPGAVIPPGRSSREHIDLVQRDSRFGYSVSATVYAHGDTYFRILRGRICEHCGHGVTPQKLPLLHPCDVGLLGKVLG
jgi:hypothetical protein